MIIVAFCIKIRVWDITAAIKVKFPGPCVLIKVTNKNTKSNQSYKKQKNSCTAQKEDVPLYYNYLL